jgi:Fe-S cluster biogenesis protein NfuA/nitrite reductase/ring-hydroxylating ferredoxin subunit
MEFDQAVAQLGTLVETLEREGDERALVLLQLMDAVHRPGLELIAQGDLEHPIAMTLLAMYDLAPVDEFVEAEEALDEVRPYIESHGGALELVAVEDGVISVRMAGSCHGCAASAMTLRRGIEEKLRERLPWFKEVVALDPEDEGEDESGDGGFSLPMHQSSAGSGAALPMHPAPDDGSITVPMHELKALVKDNAGMAQSPQGGEVDDDARAEELQRVAKLRRPVFVDVGAFEDLPPGTMKAVEVEGRSVLVINVDGEPYAVANVCPSQGARLPLEGGKLSGPVLVCPWHNCAYDVRSGKRVDDSPDDPSLAVLPIAVADGELRVAANVA